MNDRDKLREDRATRVQTFGSDNTADFVTGSRAQILLGSIDDKLEKLVLAKTGQSPDRASKATILDALWLDFKNIAASARTIGKTEPAGFSAPYAVPDDSTEKAITTHAEKLLGILEDSNAPGAEAATPPRKKPRRPPSARNSSPSKWTPISSPTSAPTARHCATRTNTTKAKTEAASKTPRPSA